MVATLRFNLDQPDDAMAHFRAVKATDMALFIYDFGAKLRDLTDTSEDGKHIDEKFIWQAWEETMEAYDLNLNRLIL